VAYEVADVDGPDPFPDPRCDAWKSSGRPPWAT